MGHATDEITWIPALIVFYSFAALTLFLLIATLMPLSRASVWWVRGFDFPRMQFLMLALGMTVLQAAVLDLSAGATWLVMAITLCCAAVQGWWIIPFTRLHPVEVLAAGQRPLQTESQSMIGIMTANVLMPNRKSDQLIALVREYSPDILVTLESDAWWQSRLDVLEPEYPYSIKCPLDNLYGMHVYSRLPLSDSHIEYLVEDGVPSMHTLVRLACGQPIRAHFLHPAPPSPTENEASSQRDAELIVVAKSVARCDLPVIVTGDLNDVAWSATTRLFRKISGLLDPRVGRGMFNTFHADFWFMRWPLDHLFHSPDFTLRDVRRLPGFGSDHFALFSKLVYTGDTVAAQEGLSADRGDHAWAAEKLDVHDVQKGDVPTPGAS